MTTSLTKIASEGTSKNQTTPVNQQKAIGSKEATDQKLAELRARLIASRRAPTGNNNPIPSSLKTDKAAQTGAELQNLTSPVDHTTFNSSVFQPVHNMAEPPVKADLFSHTTEAQNAGSISTSNAIDNLLAEVEAATEFPKSNQQGRTSSTPVSPKIVDCQKGLARTLSKTDVEQPLALPCKQISDQATGEFYAPGNKPWVEEPKPGSSSCVESGFKAPTAPSGMEKINSRQMNGDVQSPKYDSSRMTNHNGSQSFEKDRKRTSSAFQPSFQFGQAIDHSAPSYSLNSISKKFPEAPKPFTPLLHVSPQKSHAAPLNPFRPVNEQGHTAPSNPFRAVTEKARIAPLPMFGNLEQYGHTESLHSISAVPKKESTMSSFQFGSVTDQGSPQSIEDTGCAPTRPSHQNDSEVAKRYIKTDEADVQLWLEITGYHEKCFREKTLKTHSIRLQLEEIESRKRELEKEVANLEDHEGDFAQKSIPSRYAHSQTAKSKSPTSEPNKQPSVSGVKRPCSPSGMQTQPNRMIFDSATRSSPSRTKGSLASRISYPDRRPSRDESPSHDRFHRSNRFRNHDRYYPRQDRECSPRAFSSPIRKRNGLDQHGGGYRTPFDDFPRLEFKQEKKW